MGAQVGRNENTRRKNRRKEGITIIAYLIFIALILGGLILLVKLLTADEGEVDDAGQVYRATIEYNGEQYAQKTGLETVLFIGYDNTSDAEEGPTDFDQSDFLFLVVIDKANKQYTTVHVDRDTMTKISKLTSEGKLQSEEVMQITLAYAYGGKDVSMRSTNALNAVTSLLGGQHINHYVTFGMDSVPVLNNVVGGVSVEVPCDIDDDLKMTAPGEKIVLTDDQALRYVRARESLSNPTNVFRMERQRNFIESFIELFGKKVNEDENFLTDVVEKDLANKIASDDLNRVSEIAGEAVKLENAGYLTLEGEHKQGERFMEFYPDEDALQALIIKVFYEKVG